ncbi:nuclear nucleic acid-binding protein C1D [Cloeon dipterum]|uniref:nuclear nucleic acid-binding protein C1D n=1 Tax=Cloeon dipterum TaxID=197152 RepID=UPI00321FAA84
MTETKRSDDLSELNNKELEKNVSTLGEKIDQVDELLSMLSSPEFEDKYNNLDAANKAQIDLFKTYTINSLFWVYLKTKGKNATSHPVKNALGRVKEHLDKAKQLKDRAAAPRLNQGVAKRFIRSGLWEPKDQPVQQNGKNHKVFGKRKRE